MEASFERRESGITSLVLGVKAASDDVAKVVRLTFSTSGNNLKLDQVDVILDPDANAPIAVKAYSLPPRYR